MKKLKQLMMEIEGKKLAWDERSMFTIRGVRNLSPADLDTIELYANFYFRGTGHELMKPRGGVAAVLLKAGVDVDAFGA